MSYFNPTGGYIRNDGHGRGGYGESRGSRTHKGIDFDGFPGSYVCSPVDGLVERTGRPYADGGVYDCYVVVKESAERSWRLFYVRPLPDIIGKDVRRGQAIGVLMNVSLKYPENELDGAMIPHCHLELKVKGVKVDPGDASL